MESTGKYWIPVFNILEQRSLWVTLSHPKYTKPMKGNKTDRKDAKWICDLYMCGMVKPSFIPPADIREARVAIGQYIHTYNFERRHSALDYQTPAECYYPAMMLPYVA